ncbi:MAG: NADH-quinone oxidoreductase subunit J [Candidatus Melainabacteria bacterium]|nr:NADH-quinone oxidoreductase subunit J [Candidatus Melainabacteria bacterium]
MELLSQYSHLPFYILAATTVVCSLGMIFLNNLVRAGFLLIGSFCAIAGIYFLLSANFVAVSQVLIYAVGIVLVIIFSVMLCNLQEKASDVPADDEKIDRIDINTRKILGLLVSAGFFTIMYKIITDQNWEVISYATGAMKAQPDISQYTKTIGELMLGKYVIAFELVSVLLLIVLVGVIILSKKELTKEEA